MGFLFTLLDFQKQGTTTHSLTLYRICHNSVRAPPFPFAKENNTLVLKFPPPVDTTNSEEEAKKKKNYLHSQPSKSRECIYAGYEFDTIEMLINQASTTDH